MLFVPPVCSRSFTSLPWSRLWVAAKHRWWLASLAAILRPRLLVCQTDEPFFYGAVEVVVVGIVRPSLAVDLALQTANLRFLLQTHVRCNLCNVRMMFMEISNATRTRIDAHNLALGRVELSNRWSPSTTSYTKQRLMPLSDLCTIQLYFTLRSEVSASFM